MRTAIIDALEARYEAQILEADATLKIYLENSVGIGEHQDIQQAIDAELDAVATADDKLNMILKYFERRESNEAEEKKESKSK